ncbi:MAG: hypothetical protein A2287_05130 [Candidatus Melainabacteria bacterium RIFOXYA12_FULL_32_12]|nr:MAG: hypothetical protein A2104_01260 [Candidatus Melainabacteria bacterium GWF2_32_7]OGI18064.1 MAG: hypothetical protein A2255_06310 [Candidatus Melainabacteria bacterium RIFOXYA2_FULL_32_9]OGI28905.1 MAG: hypothetical protein A2287_05130 [Candidatus Melainabacteria bacterium RIFOXYA12_FULL_32_12]
MTKKTEKKFNTVTSLDVLLSDIMSQIKIITQDEKDAPYTKLIELFFKGIDLREKIINPKKQDISDPEVNVIKGIDQELI